MLRRWVFSAMAAFAFAAAPGPADAQDRRVSIRSGPLASALQQLARQTGIELIFDREMVSGYHAYGLAGVLTPDAALERLLASTAFVARRSSSGAWVLERRSERFRTEDTATPEILVIGKRTQNVDIRRRESDVQPYKVWTGTQVVQAHRDNLDQFFQSRVPANTQVLSPSLLDNGETVSEIDLRGLGTDATLVLVDGRRLPGIPSAANPFAFRQSDLNAIPLHAIERVETLTGTAGGIHGFGALGGVVNIVLKRDYRGIDLHATGGITARGDARRLSLEGRVGFTPDGGRTEVMIHLGHTRTQPLLVGQAGYALRDRRTIYADAPDLYASLTRTSHFGNSVQVFSASGNNLVLKPEYGGASLGAVRTYLPAGFEGTPGDLAAALVSRAGQADLTLTESEAASELGSHPTATSAIVNLRHDFGAGIEGFFDAVVLRNRGGHRRHVSYGSLSLTPAAPHNPFANHLRVSFPIEAGNTLRETRFNAERYTTGVTAPLLASWRGTAEATFGAAEYEGDASHEVYYADPLDPLNPFGPWDAFQQSIATLFTQLDRRTIRSRYDEQSLRLAGPLFGTGAGPATLTLLAERRSEKVMPHTAFQKFESSLRVYETLIAGRASRTVAFHGELRVPLALPSSRLPLLRSLELQLAARRQSLQAEFSRTPAGADHGERMHPEFAATWFTAGMKTSPWPWLMLRGSYATGGQPPPLETLIPVEYLTEDHVFFDPRRGNRYLTSYGFVVQKLGGSPELDLVRATTLFLGGVLSPFGEDGPRLSIDYSRVRRTGDPYMLSELVVLAHEADWPERVVRDPLTDADRANGFTGGRITMIDSRAINGSDRSVESVDGRLDWPTRFLGGQLRLYGAATLQLKNVQKGLFDPALERVGYRNGPLKLRANAGFDWTRGPTSIGASAQYFGKYRVTIPGPASRGDGNRELLQGAPWIPAQAYFDIYASHRFRTGRSLGGEFGVDVGIVNLLGSLPPRETGIVDAGPGYSRYGDPRGRRFEVTLSSSF